MKKLYFLLPAILFSLSVDARSAMEAERGITGGTSGTGLFPHFRTQNDNAQGVSSRLVAKTHLKYRNGIFLPEDSITYIYKTGDRGGYTKIDNPHNDESVYFDESYTYVFDVSTGDYYNRMLRMQNFYEDTKVKMLTYSPWSAASSGWEDSARYNYSYSGNIMTSSLLQLWYGGNWTKGIYSSLSYDGNNNVTRMSSDVYVVKFGYDANNKLVSVVDSQKNASGIWVNNERKTYSYSGGNVTVYQADRWDVVNASWVNKERTEYTYNSGSSVATSTYLLWSNGSWVNSVKHVYAYDNNGNMIEDIEQKWDVATGTFVNYKRIFVVYNVHNQPEIITTTTWTGSWMPSAGDEEVHFYYEYYFPTNVSQLANTGAGVTLFPVPATDNVNVSVSFDATQDAAFMIYDINGNVVRQWQDVAGRNYVKSVPVADLPAGNYLLKAVANQEQLVARFLISR